MDKLAKYIQDVQAELEAAQINVYHYEGALAMLRKMQADETAERHAQAEKEKQS